MKINTMVDLVNEMIDILNHNQSMINASKKLGYNGYSPAYEMYKSHFQEMKNDLIELSMQGLSDECQDKLEEACDNFCLMCLAHGSDNDEFYLCKLTQISSDEEVLSNMDDCTVTLATKYGLEVANGTAFYDAKFVELLSEVQSEMQCQNRMTL